MRPRVTVNGIFPTKTIYQQQQHNVLQNRPKHEKLARVLWDKQQRFVRVWNPWIRYIQYSSWVKGEDLVDPFFERRALIHSFPFFPAHFFNAKILKHFDFWAYVLFIFKLNLSTCTIITWNKCFCAPLMWIESALFAPDFIILDQSI